MAERTYPDCTIGVDECGAFRVCDTALIDSEDGTFPPESGVCRLNGGALALAAGAAGIAYYAYSG